MGICHSAGVSIKKMSFKLQVTTGEFAEGVGRDACAPSPVRSILSVASFHRIEKLLRVVAHAVPKDDFYVFNI